MSRITCFLLALLVAALASGAWAQEDEPEAPLVPEVDNN